MRSRHLRELHNLFKHDNDAIVLLHLVDGITAAGGRPLRFREMAKEINQSGAYVAESSLQRCVHHLESSALISIDRTNIRHPLYQPTAHGRRIAGLLISILDAFDNHDQDQEDGDSGTADSSPPRT